MPPLSNNTDTLWLRIRSDGTTVTVDAQQGVTEPGSWGGTTTTDRVYESSGFTLTGGMIAFGSSKSEVWVDDFTLRADRDGDGTYETVEHVERFTTDAGGFAATQPEHDPAGNLTYDGVYHYSYDAWNHLVRVTKAYKDEQGTLQYGSVVMEADYDGLGRRAVKYVKNSADLDSTYHYYYDDQRIIETRNGSDLVIKQHVWGLQYIDKLVQTSINEDPADLSEQDCERTYYALHNANYNVMALVDAQGVLIERYEYDPYGKRSVYFSTGENDPGAHAPIDISRRVEIGTIPQPYGLNNVGHQGLMHDEVVGLIHNRRRTLHPRWKRFNQHDPLGYVDGMNQYQYEQSNSINRLDTFGTKTTKDAVIIPNGWGHMEFDLDMIRKSYFFSGEWGLKIDQWGGSMRDGGGWITVAATGYTWNGHGLKTWGSFASARQTRSIEVTCTCPDDSNGWFISADVDPGTPGGKQGVVSDGDLSVTATLSVQYVSQRTVQVTGEWGASITYDSPIKIGISPPTLPGINAEIELPTDAYINWGPKTESWTYVCPEE